MIEITTYPEQREAEVRRIETQLQELRAVALSIALGHLSDKSIQYSSPDQGMEPTGGFDCSGFVSHVYSKAAAKVGVDLVIPRHANEQWRELGEFVAYPKRAAGDLVFFPSRKKHGLRIMGHVGIVLDANEYIHAPGKKNTVIRTDQLPEEPELLEDVQPNDLYTHTPAGIKRISLPFGDGRWHVY